MEIYCASLKKKRIKIFITGRTNGEKDSIVNNIQGYQCHWYTCYVAKIWGKIVRTKLIFFAKTKRKQSVGRTYIEPTCFY